MSRKETEFKLLNCSTGTSVAHFGAGNIIL